MGVNPLPLIVIAVASISFTKKKKKNIIVAKMSHMTADLEYFKCDMCGVYMHRDIFCDHRRDCHGRDSAILKRAECAKLTETLSRETRELLLARESEAGATRAANPDGGSGSMLSSRGEDASNGVSAPSRCGSSSVVGSCTDAKEESRQPAGSNTLASISASISAAEAERRQEARTRRAVSDRYQSALDAKIGAMLTDEKRASLMSFLKA